MRVVTIRLSGRIKAMLLLWCLAEMLAFAVVVNFIGVGGAVLLGIATSLLGFSVLKRAGMAAMLKLRAALEGGRAIDAPADMRDETLAAAGALALLLPGFLSDIVGAALIVPALRALVLRLVSRRRRSPLPGTIDLDPDEWRRSEPVTRPISKI